MDKHAKNIIEWFGKIKQKHAGMHTFISFDIFDFYPSIRRKIYLAKHYLGPQI